MNLAQKIKERYYRRLDEMESITIEEAKQIVSEVINDCCMNVTYRPSTDFWGQNIE